MFAKSFLSLFLFSSIFFFQLTWKTIKIDEKVSISFPSKVEKMVMDNKPVWLSDVDSASKCMIMITDMKKMGVDAKTLTEMLKRKETFKSIKNGILAGSTGSVALKESITTFKNYPAYYIELDMKGEPNEFNKTYIMNIFIGAKMYSMTFAETYQTKHVQQRNKFFESFRVK
ncbi:MAG: hypothetical protein EOP00_12205 [Pedobacter sp.]|nr:MAG: hypothetical protein EOP00_12205 [Pedobacter sp.]